MFASTRCFIHRTLRLNIRNNFGILTQEEEQILRNLKGLEHHDVQLRFLSYMGERGLLQYAQQVYIYTFGKFTPYTLLPHLHHFRSLDQVRALTIEEYDAVSWATHYKICFSHFYPTLTSLTLRYSFDHHQLLLQFALQFPRLEDLCLEWMMKGGLGLDLDVPLAVGQSAPLSGHLRLVGYRTVDRWPVDFVSDLPNGINFRSVELESFRGHSAQRILDACVNTLEDVTFVFSSTGEYSLILVFLIDVVH